MAADPSTPPASPTDEKFYAVHCGNNTGIYRTWPEMLQQIEGVRNPVYKKCDSLELADHFVEHGVSAWGNNPQTIHAFISANESSYCVYFDLPGDTPKVEKVAKEWDEQVRRRELASLLALSKCLEICSTNTLLCNRRIIVHFEDRYPYQCASSWIKSWKRNGWVKKDNSRVSHQVLLQIIDAQQARQPNVHYHYVPNRNMVSGISGFRKVHKALSTFQK